MLFNIDISRQNENIRLIVRKIDDFDKIYNSKKKKINIFLQKEKDKDLIRSLFHESSSHNNSFYLYIKKDNNLIILNVPKKYDISSFNFLDQLSDAKKIDYSIEIN